MNHRTFDAEILRCANGCIDSFRGVFHTWDEKIAFEFGLHIQAEFPKVQAFAWQETNYFTVSAVNGNTVWIALLDKDAGKFFEDLP